MYQHTHSCWHLPQTREANCAFKLATSFLRYDTFKAKWISRIFLRSLLCLAAKLFLSRCFLYESLAESWFVDLTARRILGLLPKRVPPFFSAIALKASRSKAWKSGSSDSVSTSMHSRFELDKGDSGGDSGLAGY